MHARTLCFAFLLAIPSIGSAQVVHEVFAPIGNTRYLGLSAAAAGDVNADGFPDLIVGAPGGGGTYTPTVFVYSGFDHSILHVLMGNFPDDFYGISVDGIGDVNGDGYGDLIARSRGVSFTNGYARVISGRHGTVLYDLPNVFLSSGVGDISGAGDVNGDGVEDILLGTYGEVRVHSGGTGALIYAIPDAAGLELARRVSEIGDLDADGHDEFLVGGFGSATVYSGIDGSVMHQLGGAGLGTDVAGLGDIDLDGVPDFIVGASSSSVGGPNRGRIWVYSGATASVLFDHVGLEDQSYFGSVVSAAGDFNGDGRRDYMASAPWHGPLRGIVRVFSGVDGTEIATFEGFENASYFGISLAGLGNIDGAGSDEILIGASHEGGPNSGRVRIYSMEPPLGDKFCFGVSCPSCNNSDPENGCENVTGRGARLAATGSASLGADDLDLYLSGLPPSQSLIIFMGASTSLPMSLSAGLRCIPGQVFRFPILTASADGNANQGVGMAGFAIASFGAGGQILAGSNWNFQAWYRETFPGPGSCFGVSSNLSNAIGITFAP